MSCKTYKLQAPVLEYLNHIRHPYQSINSCEKCSYFLENSLISSLKDKESEY